MIDIQKHIFNANKGILAIDESESTSHARFEAKGLESTPELRRAWRSTIINMPNLENYLSGIIAVEETVGQKDDKENQLYDQLAKKNIKIFVKVDEGLDTNNNQPLTKGLENLDKKLIDLNNKFTSHVIGTKWRIVVLTSRNKNDLCEETKKSLEQLAKYAKIVLKHNLIPIVEPEIIVDEEVSKKQTIKLHIEVIKHLLQELKRVKLPLGKIILKMSFVYTLSQKNEYKKELSAEIANQTLEVLELDNVKDLMGIVYLSGGLNPLQATNIMNKIREENKGHIRMTFSFGRAIQDEAFDEWVKTMDFDNKKVQEKLINRLKEICKRSE